MCCVANKSEDGRLQQLLHKVSGADEELGLLLAMSGILYFCQHFHSLNGVMVLQLLSYVEEEHLPFLFRTLHSLAPKWYGFCVQLGVKGLDHIQRNGTSVDDCLVLALQSWLRGDEACCNWAQLVTAIYRAAGGGNHRLAGDVAESFQGSKHCVIVCTNMCSMDQSCDIVYRTLPVIRLWTILCSSNLSIYSPIPIIIVPQLCVISTLLSRPVLPALHRFVSLYSNNYYGTRSEVVQPYPIHSQVIHTVTWRVL